MGSVIFALPVSMGIAHVSHYRSPRCPSLCRVRPVALVSLVPARAEDDVLSDRLTDQILQMNKLDLVRKLDSEFERRTHELSRARHIERANKFRELLKSRAATYELLEDFERPRPTTTPWSRSSRSIPSSITDRGYFYMRQSRFSEAVRDFIDGFALAPSQSSFNYGAGRAFSRMGDYAEAAINNMGKRSGSRRATASRCCRARRR